MDTLEIIIISKVKWNLCEMIGIRFQDVDQSSKRPEVKIKFLFSLFIVNQFIDLITCVCVCADRIGAISTNLSTVVTPTSKKLVTNGFEKLYILFSSSSHVESTDASGEKESKDFG